eukprot:TRINITY_DN3827_c0_g1_i2.p1 TRINITY_DN3827_c0_g1~~TRINITY_DN3827_c0_g1_i2.p1  ORF type:complete len:132 (+),score=29.58 TRINITY_DN3827_c0_g1_i2:328-723(+)
MIVSCVKCGLYIGQLFQEDNNEERYCIVSSNLTFEPNGTEQSIPYIPSSSEESSEESFEYDIKSIEDPSDAPPPKKWKYLIPLTLLALTIGGIALYHYYPTKSIYRSIPKPEGELVIDSEFGEIVETDYNI